MSQNNNNNYIISLVDNVIVTIRELNFFNSNFVTVTDNRLEATQNWVNNISDLTILEEFINSPFIETINLELLKSELDNFRLPSFDVVHQMSLLELTEYEVMLLEFMDKIPSNVHISVNILLHLKIIHNHLIYKFKLFE